MSERMSKIQETNKSYGSVEAWRAEARRLFGDDSLDWRFACPSCGHEQSVRDYKEAGAPEGAVGFSCVGRYMDDSVGEAFNDDGKAPCNYAGGGLFRLNPITVELDDGKTMSAFAFAKPKPSRCAGSSERRRCSNDVEFEAPDGQCPWCYGSDNE